MSDALSLPGRYSGCAQRSWSRAGNSSRTVLVRLDGAWVLIDSSLADPDDDGLRIPDADMAQLRPILAALAGREQGFAEEAFEINDAVGSVKFWHHEPSDMTRGGRYMSVEVPGPGGDAWDGGVWSWSSDADVIAEILAAIDAHERGEPWERMTTASLASALHAPRSHDCAIIVA